MRYTDPSFTVAPSGSYEQAHSMCKQHGHMEPDTKGKCLRCGEKIASPVGHEAFCRAPEGFVCGCKTVILPPFR